MARFTGNDLKRTRDLLGINQSQFARLIGSKSNTLCKAETVRPNEYISDELNKKVNKALIEQGIDPETLLLLIKEVEEVLKKKYGLKKNQDR